MGTLIRVWSVLDPRQRRRLLLLLCLSLLMSFTTMLGIAAVIPFFAVLADPQIIHRNAALSVLHAMLPQANDRAFLIALGGAFVALVLIGNLISLLSARAISRYSHAVGGEFSSALFEEYVRRDYGFHARADAEALATKVLVETGRVATGIVEHGLLLVTSFVTVVIIITTVLLLNPLVALCISSLLGASYGLVYLLCRRQLRRNGQRQSVHLAERAKAVSEGFGAIKEIIVTQTQSYFLRRFERSADALARLQADTQITAQSPRYVLEFLTAAALVVVALGLSAQQKAGIPWLAQLSFFALAAYRLMPALQQVFHALVKIRANAPALDGIIDDLRRARSCSRDTAPVDGQWRGRPQHAIALSGVAFRYGSGLPWVLSDVTMRIPAGRIIAFVGRNGAGKTALADLVLGLLVPQAGTLEVDGVLIDDANRLAWQSIAAYVPQQIYLLDASIGENIAFGHRAGEIDATRLHEAAKLARLTDFMATLPAGYDTIIGERGIRLSGGMRQRVGIARALYRQSSVLVLDEATNSLDAPTENEVVEVLRELRGSHTLIVIAHGQHVMGIADLAYEVRDGSVALRASQDVSRDAAIRVS